MASKKQDIEIYDGDFEVFLVGDIIWAKLKGHPVWPAKVISFEMKLFLMKIRSN